MLVECVFCKKKSPTIGDWKRVKESIRVDFSEREESDAGGRMERTHIGWCPICSLKFDVEDYKEKAT